MVQLIRWQEVQSVISFSQSTVTRTVWIVTGFRCEFKFQVCFIYIAHLKTASMADQSAEQTKT